MPALLGDLDSVQINGIELLVQVGVELKDTEHWLTRYPDPAEGEETDGHTR